MGVAEEGFEQAVSIVRQAALIARGYALAASAGRSEFVVCELAATLRIGEVAAGSLLAQALQLIDSPVLVDAVHAGRVGVPQLRVLLEETAYLADPALVGPVLVGPVLSSVLADVADRTPARVRQLVRRAVLAADPAAAGRRRKAAVADRGVWLRPEPDVSVRVLAPRSSRWLGPGRRWFGSEPDCRSLELAIIRCADQRRSRADRRDLIGAWLRPH